MKVREQDLFRIAGVTAAAALGLTFYVAWALTPIQGDVAIIREAQSIEFFRRFESWVNPLGSIDKQLVLVVAVIAAIVVGPKLGFSSGTPLERTQAIWMLIAALVLRLVAGPLKAAVQSERPSTANDVIVARHFDGYGFPSGHVYSDVLIFGVLAVIAPVVFGRTFGSALRVVCIAIIVFAGPARMVVGAHWPSDVLGGYLWGAAALCIAVIVGRRLGTAR